MIVQKKEIMNIINTDEGEKEKSEIELDRYYSRS